MCVCVSLLYLLCMLCFSTLHLFAWVDAVFGKGWHVQHVQHVCLFSYVLVFASFSSEVLTLAEIGIKRNDRKCLDDAQGQETKMKKKREEVQSSSRSSASILLFFRTSFRRCQLFAVCTEMH